MKQASLTIEGERCLSVRVARNFFEKSRGLSNLPHWDGMPLVFLFKRPCRPPFWMHRVSFPLDLVWVSKGKIVGIARNLPPARSRLYFRNILFLKRHYPPVKIDTVVELKAGEARHFGLTLGQRVVLEC